MQVLLQCQTSDNTKPHLVQDFLQISIRSVQHSWQRTPHLGATTSLALVLRKKNLSNMMSPPQSIEFF